MKKILSSIPLHNYKILTDTGFQPAPYFNITEKYEIYKIRTETNKKISCADNHIFFTENFQEVLTKDLVENSSKIFTKNGLELVTKIEKTSETDYMFDFTVFDENSRYYTNDILSHNTTIVTGIILHFVTFNKSKRVFILGEKSATAIEVLDRIKFAYERLPDFLKVGIKKWNIKEIIFENGCSISAAASNSRSIAGKSCVGGNTEIIVKNKKTGIVETIKIKEEPSHEEYEIFDGEKFRDFCGFQILEKELFRLNFENLIEIDATNDHRFLAEDGEFYHVHELNDEISIKNAGKLISKNSIGINLVYDALNVAHSNRYYTNGIISHNCAFLYIDECIGGNSIVDVLDDSTGEDFSIRMYQLYDLLESDQDKKYSVLTEDGWKDFKGVSKSFSNDVIKITFENGKNLTCTRNHKIKNNGTFVEASKLQIGDEFDYTFVKSIEDAEAQYVYDILDVEDVNEFIANDITSSNCAHIPNWDKFSAAVLPTLSSGKTSRLVYTSTPNGLNHFWTYSEGAKQGKNDFKYYEIPWHKVPGRDEEWKKRQIEELNGDLDKFEQEYNCCYGAALVELTDDSDTTFSIKIEDLYTLKNNHALPKLKVLSNNSACSFHGVRRNLSETYLIKTSSYSLRCTIDHKLLNHNNQWLELRYLKVLDKIHTKTGIETIQSIEYYGKEYVYDLLEVSNGNAYYTNDILSHNCAFMGSSGTLISGSVLKLLTYIRPKEESELGLKIYEEVEEEKIYAITCDVSRGKNLDYSTFSVFDITDMPYKQVATFASNTIAPPDFAIVIHNVSKTYNNAYVLVEINDIGEHVAYNLWDELENENLLMTEAKGKMKVVATSWKDGKTDYGLRTTKYTKKMGCLLLKLLIEQNKLIINDKKTIDELQRFSRKGESYEAEEGCHDDMVATLFIFAWLSQDVIFKELASVRGLSALRVYSDEDMENDMPSIMKLTDGVDVNSVDDVQNAHYLNSGMNHYDADASITVFELDYVPDWMK